MHIRPRWFAEAAGAALLILLPYFAQLLLPFNIAIYHHRLPLLHLTGAILLDLLGLTLLGVALMAALSRLPSLPRRALAAGLAGVAVWRFVSMCISLFGAWHSNLDPAGALQSSGFALDLERGWGRLTRPLAFAVLLLCPLLAGWNERAARRFTEFARLGLAAFAFSLLWIVPTLVSIASISHEPAAHLVQASEAGHEQRQRIVWILFDELSYDLVFDHPPPGQTFPNFAALHSVSSSFGNLQPAGFFTDRIIPTLLAGFPIHEIRSSSTGDLWYLDETAHRWRAYDPNQTLIALAHNGGWNPGIAGWYNPYCRIFGGLLAACSWRPGVQTEVSFEVMGASEEKSVLENSLVVPRSILIRSLTKTHLARTNTLEQNIHDYRSILDHASALIQNDRIHFVFAHLPVPHPPGIFNRQTHQIVEGGNYLDNLALADDTLGILLHQIERSRSANKTVVIVSSDHSWRVPAWRRGIEWTSEEEAISRGRYETRPVFLVHFPGEKSGADILAPMPEIAEHEIVAAMLNGQVTDPAGLDRLLQSIVH